MNRREFLAGSAVAGLAAAMIFLRLPNVALYLTSFNTMGVGVFYVLLLMLGVFLLVGFCLLAAANRSPKTRR